MILTLVHDDPARWRQLMLDHLTSYADLGVFAAALDNFWPVLLFSAVILAVGRLAHWPAAHLSLPLLAWAWTMTRELIRSFDFHIPHAIFFVIHLLEGAIALVVVVALVGLAAIIQGPRSPGRADQISWVTALLAVATAIADWALMLTFILPWGEGP